MIGIILLSLPLMCLISGIIYFSYHLYKLNQVKVPAANSEALTCELQDYNEDDIRLIMELLSSVSTDLKFQSMNEYSDDLLDVLLNASLLNEKHESLKLDNRDSTVVKSFFAFMDSLVSTQKSHKEKQLVNSWNRENTICQLQNAS